MPCEVEGTAVERVLPAAEGRGCGQQEKNVKRTAFRPVLYVVTSDGYHDSLAGDCPIE